MRLKSIIIFSLTLFSITTYAANLLNVYSDALQNDPVYQQAIAQELSDSEGVPISLANLFPNANGNITPTLSKTNTSGSATAPGTTSARGYDVNLTVTQTVFDLGKFVNLSIARELAKQASATLNAATQDLIIRVSKAYLTVLEDKDILRSIGSAKAAYAKQLDQVNEEYKVGVKTVTDAYTAKAAYENSLADFIEAENKLSNDRENLRAITGILYPELLELSRAFPLITPMPASIDEWVKTTIEQNWSIRASQYAKSASLKNIKQQNAGHFPTLNAQGSYDINYTRTMGGPSQDTDTDPILSNGLLFGTGTGSSKIKTASVGVTLGIPIFQGGAVIAKTNRAKYDYLVASERLEKQMRDQTNLARQSFLGVISGISKIKADLETITATKSSLEGMEAGYSVGTETLVNVLNQRQRVYEAEKQYATDRYTYVTSLLTLKQAAGTLSYQDVIAINSWLIEPKNSGF